MKKFEYKVVSYTEMENAFPVSISGSDFSTISMYSNYLGKEGWELVGFEQRLNTFILKREI
ncbi:MAG: DUF4177 domain-containing protein [Clostridia bacterium]|nr:DUF4177 domain-containing protein [Clostridia bacterium]